MWTQWRGIDLILFGVAITLQRQGLLTAMTRLPYGMRGGRSLTVLLHVFRIYLPCRLWTSGTGCVSTTRPD